MDTKSKILFWGLGVLVVASVALTYYRSFISKDYEIIPLEPESEEIVTDAVAI